MDTERLEALLQKLAINDLSNDEAAELQLLVGDKRSADAIKAWLTTKMGEQPAAASYDADRFDPMFKQILSIDRFEKAPNNIRSLSFRWLKYAAAAAIIISAGWFFMERKSTIDKPVISQVQKTAPDLGPGSDRAMLTLSDGSTVEVLPSAATLQDGRLRIANNGKELDYRAAGQSAITDGTSAYNTMTTPRGGQYKLTLSDGTRVWLNASSSITFPTAFAGSTRKVQITGEVYFEVSRNPSKPFYVSSDQMEIEVLGTHFNVNAYSDEPSISTTLLEGSVRLKSTQPNHTNTIVLKPGEQAQMTGGEEKIAVKKNADLEQIVAWKNGINSFKDADIKTIMRQVSRWYDVDVEFEGKIPASQTFTGEFSRSDNASKIFSLFDFAGIRCRIEGKKVIVMQ